MGSKSVKEQSGRGKEGGKRVVLTTTDEPYFPCRLIYRVFDHRRVLKELRSIQCIVEDRDARRWAIHCCDEALESKWSSKYHEQLNKGEPGVIGIIRFPDGDRMDIYIRCFQRVVPVLELIDRYIARVSAIGTHIDICYELVTASGPMSVPAPEEFFADEASIYYEDEFKVVDELEEKARVTGKDYSKEIDRVFNQAAKTVIKQSFSWSMPRLQRKRLEAFYVDGAEEYARVMIANSVLALARHEGGGKLNVFKFFRKLFKKT